MKIISQLFMLCLGLVVIGCSTSKSNVSKTSQPDEVRIVGESGEESMQVYQNLAQRLRKVGGIEVIGTGENVSIVIRGISTITGDTNPIYVVNGLDMGSNYASVNQAIDVNRIKSIRILRSKSETSIYGGRGVNGVIIIKTN